MTTSTPPSQRYLETAPAKGFRDFYPEQEALQRWIFGKMSEVVERFGYQAYKGPILESKEMYVAKSGEELGGEQLYHFLDKGEREMAIRPEMTPSLARMVAARANQLVYPLRWYSIPNLLRYERPQRGRTREHWQLNVDLIGVNSIYAEAEIIEIGCQLLRAFGAQDADFRVRINHRQFMNEFLTGSLGLAETQTGAVLRCIDRKAKVPPEAFIEALSAAGLSSAQQSQLSELFELSVDQIEQRYASSSPGAQQLVQLLRILDTLGLSSVCVFDPQIVRGIAYYTGTVFELQDTNPVNRRSLFGGGRYDNLLNLFQKNSIPCVGLGLGDVTIADFLETHGLLPTLNLAADVFIVFQEQTPELVSAGQSLAQQLRKAGLKVETSLPLDQRLDKQLRLADKKQVPLVVIVGQDELSKGCVAVRSMRTREQELVELPRVVATLQAKLGQA
jgi:histidyl-tRNA synthetase